MSFIDLDYIKKFIDNKKTIFWGASNFLKSILENKHRPFNNNVVGIIDKNSNLWGQELGGYKIYPPKDINSLGADTILVTIKNQHNNAHKNIKRFLNNSSLKIELLPDIFCTEADETNELIKKYNNEVIFMNTFFNLINNSSWVKKRDFIPINAAANSSLLLLLYCILENIKPSNILEFGMGQTSKLTTQYIVNKNPQANLKIIEHDQKWLEYFSKQLDNCPNIKFVQKDIIDFKYENSLSMKYADLSDILESQKFDFIIIDGPIGGNQEYPRSNIIDIIPNNLADDFIIIFDDAERLGESNTISLLKDSLKRHNIKFIESYKLSTKCQMIITSENLKYATYY